MSAVMKALKELHEVQTIEVTNEDGRKATVLAVPSGVTIQSVKDYIEEYLELPERKTGTTKLSSLRSFIHFVNRQKDESSAVFADLNPNAPKLTAVFDYHLDTRIVKNEVNNGARWCEHKAVYEFPLAKQWVEWKRIDGKWLNQTEFAHWIEDHIQDVAEPAEATTSVKAVISKLDCFLAGSARLIELAKGLTVRIDSKVENSIRLSSGETQFSFSHEHKNEAGAPIEVPNAFMLAIPLFNGGTLYPITVRLRYKVNKEEGKISWQFALYRTQECFDAAVQAAISRVTNAPDAPLIEDEEQFGTGLPVYEGTL